MDKDDQELMKAIKDYGKMKIVRSERGITVYNGMNFWESHTKFLKSYKGTKFYDEVKRQLDEHDLNNT